LYVKLKFAPEVRCVSGQSPTRSKPEKFGFPPEQSCPSWMNPSVRPAPSERSTENQL
jgi:hypothetical protein